MGKSMDVAERQSLGVWQGNLAEELGKAGKTVTREDFKAFLRSDVVSMGGKPEWSRPRTSEIKYIEFTYTAPKAFSICAALDDRLKPELMAAVQDEFTWFEAAASARDRRGDLASGEFTRSTGNMMAALFQHETSRTNDPNFHVHGLIGNMTLDRDRNQVLAMHYGEMLELRKTLDARIHNNLARRLGVLGYHVEVAENGFALQEVPRTAIEMFSARARQVESVEKLFSEGFSKKDVELAIHQLQSRGDALDYSKLRALLPTSPQVKALAMPRHEAHEAAVLLTRPEKEEITSTALREITLEKLAEAGLKITPPAGQIVHTNVDLHAAVERGVAAVFEKDAVVRLDQLIGEIARLAPGAASNEALADLLRQDGRFLVGRMPTPDRPNGVDLITTLAILREERELLQYVAAGLGRAVAPIIDSDSYRPPAVLASSPERIAEMVGEAAKKGEVLSEEMARAWLEQFSGIHRYIATSTDRFANIRGGAGVGKTFCMEILVGDSLRDGRNVVLMAPYGEQSRVTMRAECERLEKAGKVGEAAAFREANTVAHYLLKAKQNEDFRISLRGADIYVDEAGLLDTPTALALVKLASECDARVIFQGDTEQKLAVGRGSPMEVLQERLKLGMHVERANISRRQQAAEDKRLAQELSSGDGERFGAALERFIERGDVQEKNPSDAVKTAAVRVLDARGEGKDLLVFASVHRLCDSISDEIHEQAVSKNAELKVAKIDVWKAKNLQSAEHRSPQFYEVGNAVEWQSGKKTYSGVVASIDGKVMVSVGKSTRPLDLDKVTEVYERKLIDRGIGAHVVLTDKITHGKNVYERNSRHKITRIGGGFLSFDSGLKLAVDDGRLRQGDVLTVDKSQGAKGKSVLWVEDNRSLMAMSNRRDVHVGFTRHVKKVQMLVESIDVFRTMAVREKKKISALNLEEEGRTARWSSHENRLKLQQREAVKALIPPLPSATRLARRLRRASASQRGRSHRHIIHKAAKLVTMSEKLRLRYTREISHQTQIKDSIK